MGFYSERDITSTSRKPLPTPTVDIRPIAIRTAQRVAPTLTMQQLVERIDQADAMLADTARDTPAYVIAEAAREVFQTELDDRYQ